MDSTGNRLKIVNLSMLLMIAIVLFPTPLIIWGREIEGWPRVYSKVGTVWKAGLFLEVSYQLLSISIGF